MYTFAVHLNYMFPVETGIEPVRWKTILQKNLNGKCRSFRRQLRMKEEQKPPLNDQSAPEELSPTAQKSLQDNMDVTACRVEDAANATQTS